MKFIIFLSMALVSLCGCQSKSADEKISIEKFDKTGWSIKIDDDYPNRPKMYRALITDNYLKGWKKDEILDLLGEPDRVDSNFLFYTISQKKVGFFPLHTKTLVIKFDINNKVEWRKIHE